MKKLIIAMLLGSFSAIAAENCQQAPRLLKVRKDVTILLTTLAPINNALLESNGELKESIEFTILRSDLVESGLRAAIESFDNSKISTNSIGEDISNLIKESFKRCLKTDEVLNMIDVFEKFKFASASYKNTAKAFNNASINQLNIKKIIQADIDQATSSAPDEVSKEFLERYSGINKDIALNHANDYLIEVETNITIIDDVLSNLKDQDLDAVFIKVNLSLDAAIEKLYEVAELSKE